MMARLVSPLHRLRDHFTEVIRIKKSPKSIAFGFALGSFIGLLPTPGFGVLLGVLLTLTYTKINKFSLFAGLLLWNPILLVPAYSISYRIGDVLFGEMPVVGIDLPLLDSILHVTRRFLVGNLILASLVSTLSYLIIHEAVKAYQSRKWYKRV
jgi:uncharacterized protein (DUF2062 family)